MARPTADEIRSTPPVPPMSIPAGEERERRSRRPTAAELHGSSAPPKFEPAVPGGKPAEESPAVRKSRQELEMAQNAERAEKLKADRQARIDAYAKRLEEAKAYAVANMFNGVGDTPIFRDLSRVSFLNKVEFDSLLPSTAVIDHANTTQWAGTVLLSDGRFVYVVRPPEIRSSSFYVPISSCQSLHPMKPGE